MSIAVMTKVWAMDLPAKDKLILLALADCANDEGEAWPSIATLARKCGSDPRTIQRNLRGLEAAGFIRREEVVGKGNRYFFGERRTPGKSPPRRSAPPAKSTKTPGKSPPKPSRTVIRDLADAKSKRASKSASEFTVPDWMPAEAWAAFLDMRDRKGAWPSPGAVDLIVDKLDRWRAAGHDPGDVLNTSTMNNWTGVFEPKATRNDRPTASDDEYRSPYSRAATEREAERAAAQRG